MHGADVNASRAGALRSYITSAQLLCLRCTRQPPYLAGAEACKCAQTQDIDQAMSLLVGDAEGLPAPAIATIREAVDGVLAQDAAAQGV